MTVRRITGSSGFTLIEWAELIAVAPNPDIAEDNVDPFRQWEVDLTDYLEWVSVFGTDGLMELIRARLSEEDDPEGWNDESGLAATAATRNRQSRLLH